jgi:magnesium-protoporphyrin IX monomethyl ester (oxidative) cyclase
VHLTVATPYPGTELFHTEPRELTSVDYRLYDIQHAVTETKLPLREFYQQLVETQSIINRKFMGWRTAAAVSKILAGQLVRGQTNFLQMLFKFPRAYNVDRFHGDHSRPVKYAMRRPGEYPKKQAVKDLLVHVNVPSGASSPTAAVAAG